MCMALPGASPIPTTEKLAECAGPGDRNINRLLERHVAGTPHAVWEHPRSLRRPTVGTVPEHVTTP
jgi:hypothetical protein